MPTYQYSCTQCGHFMEVVQSFSDDSLTVCPECEGRLRKVFGAVGVVFKGSGFYRTDSRSGSGADTGSSGSSGSSSKESGSKDSSSKDSGSAGKDAKPAVKSGSSTSSSSSSSTSAPKSA